MRSLPFYVFARSWIESNNTRSAVSKFKATIIALAIGCVIAIIVMSAQGVNGGQAFGQLFTDAFHPFKLSSTLITASIFIVAGVANAIAFKSGLFNIGVSGQMFFSAVIGIIFGIQIIPSTGVGGVLLLIVICMVTGGIVSGFAGVLKATFNIHEVVSTIILNWGLFFLGRWILMKVPGLVIDNGQGGTRSLTSDMVFLFRVPNASYIVLGCFGIAFAFLIAFVFWKTTFGFKAKAVGLSPEASDYAGINRRRRIIFSMGLSGLAAGLAGAIAFVMVDRNISSNFFVNDLLPSWGFDGIAIALLAFNNPIGVIPIAVFLGAIKSGATSLSIIGLESQVYDLVLGIIMYLSAVSAIFIHFRILQMLWTYYKLGQSVRMREAKLNFLTKSQSVRGVINAHLIAKSKMARRVNGTCFARVSEEHVSAKRALSRELSAKVGASVSILALSMSNTKYLRKAYARYLLGSSGARNSILAEFELANQVADKKQAKANIKAQYKVWKTHSLADISREVSQAASSLKSRHEGLVALRKKVASQHSEQRLAAAQSLVSQVTFIQAFKTGFNKSWLYLFYYFSSVQKLQIKLQSKTSTTLKQRRIRYVAELKKAKLANKTKHEQIWLVNWRTVRSNNWLAINQAYKRELGTLKQTHNHRFWSFGVSHFYLFINSTARLFKLPSKSDLHHREYSDAKRLLAAKRSVERRKLLILNRSGHTAQARATLKSAYQADKTKMYNEFLSARLALIRPLFAPREQYRNIRRQSRAHINTEFLSRTTKYDALVRKSEYEVALEKYKASPRGYSRKVSYQKIVKKLIKHKKGTS